MKLFSIDPKTRRYLRYLLGRCLWLPGDRPQRMYRYGRQIDQEFAPEEALFLRCKEEHVKDGEFAMSAIGFPDQSVNRGKHSKPGDVLIPDGKHDHSKHWIFYGIIEFSVSAIPKNTIPSAASLRSAAAKLPNFTICAR